MAASSSPRTLPLLGLVVGAWALLPPYSGPELNTEMRVEVADHVVPGVVVILAALVALALAQRASRLDRVLLGAGLAVLLAGFWMTATHVPLVAQALRDEAPVGGTIYHGVPGLVVGFLGAAWSGRYWTAATS